MAFAHTSVKSHEVTQRKAKKSQQTADQSQSEMLLPSGNVSPEEALGSSDSAVGSRLVQSMQQSGGNQAVVQAKSKAGDENLTQTRAAEGVSGTGGTLPHLATIQKSFGKHNVSNIQAYGGVEAQKASRDMGAKAYATGNKVAYDGSLDLHTAAHEAAHVVQQRGGVQLKGGVGQSGDQYEQHADRVADLVVQGKSAEAELDTMATGGGGDSAVQMRQTGGQNRTPEQEKARKEGKLEGLGFDEMWDAHPHNYQDMYEGGREAQDTASSEVLDNEGLPTYLSNTCAIRLSVMFNNLGGAYKITKANAAKAGISARRVFYSRKTKNYYVVSAREMWQYVEANFRSADVIFPKGRRFKDDEEFEAALPELMKIVSGKKGIVAFDKIFGYSGTGHVDIFEGERLSDADSWYESASVKLWFV
ncbi:MAG: hypothetical protein CMH54_09020 [Myxococcales bacterium]|nr:hypothetical protein [Myxococcales bacterium]|tara:strand:+ start:2000 stop:3253 length:1254 start_codon:yes stop_codon:yes gene_type:complete